LPLQVATLWAMTRQADGLHTHNDLLALYLFSTRPRAQDCRHEPLSAGVERKLPEWQAGGHCWTVARDLQDTHHHCLCTLLPTNSVISGRAGLCQLGRGSTLTITLSHGVHVTAKPVLLALEDARARTRHSPRLRWRAPARLPTASVLLAVSSETEPAALTEWGVARQVHGLRARPGGDLRADAGVRAADRRAPRGAALPAPPRGRRAGPDAQARPLQLCGARPAGRRAPHAVAQPADCRCGARAPSSSLFHAQHVCP